jgi:PKD repeat protein
MRRLLAATARICLLVCMLVALQSSPEAAQVQVIASGLTAPFSLVELGSDLYWTEGSNYVKWCNKAGGPLYSYWDSGGFPGWTDVMHSGWGILATDGNNLYFAQRGPSGNAPSAIPTQGPAPLTVQFAAGSPIGNVTGWFWTFGDGSTGGGKNPSHTFVTPNMTYHTSLCVTGPGGTNEQHVGTVQVTTTAGPGAPNNPVAGGIILPSPQIVRFPSIASPQTLPQPLFNYASAFGNGSTGGPLAVRNGKVFFGYWLSNYVYSFNIRGVPANGSFGAGQVISLCQNDRQVTCMAADVGDVYWGVNHNDGTGGAIHSVAQVGGISSTVATLSGFPISLATPTSGDGSGKIFWLESSSLFNLLKTCPVSGGQVSVLDTMAWPMAMGNVNALAVDSANVYYFGYSPFPSVLQRSLADNSLTVLATGLINPQAIAVDNNYVYWTDFGDFFGSAGQGTVSRVLKNSGRIPIPQISSILPLLLTD